MALRQAPEPTPVECCGLDAAAPDVVPPDVVPPDDDTLAAPAKALAHPARVKILRVLDARQACVTGDVVVELGLAQCTVSEHLRILREAGLIQGEIEGPRTRYCISTSVLASLKAGIAALCRETSLLWPREMWGPVTEGLEDLGRGIRGGR